MPTFSLMAMHILAWISPQNEKAEGKAVIQDMSGYAYLSGFFLSPANKLSYLCQRIKLTFKWSDRTFDVLVRGYPISLFLVVSGYCTHAFCCPTEVINIFHCDSEALQKWLIFSLLQKAIFFSLLSCCILWAVARQNKGCTVEGFWVGKTQHSESGYDAHFVWLYYKHTVQPSAVRQKLCFVKNDQGPIFQKELMFANEIFWKQSVHENYIWSFKVTSIL